MSVQTEVFYNLVNTEPEPVPEPLTVGGTALALAGLSWLKQKKKMAA
ncbi:PEP-CTERM sorting domain-containing protein [Microcoleus sp. K1-B1]